MASLLPETEEPEREEPPTPRTSRGGGADRAGRVLIIEWVERGGGEAAAVMRRGAGGAMAAANEA